MNTNKIFEKYLSDWFLEPHNTLSFQWKECQVFHVTLWFLLNTRTIPFFEPISFITWFFLYINILWKQTTILFREKKWKFPSDSRRRFLSNPLTSERFRKTFWISLHLRSKLIFCAIVPDLLIAHFNGVTTATLEPDWGELGSRGETSSEDSSVCCRILIFRYICLTPNTYFN